MKKCHAFARTFADKVRPIYYIDVVVSLPVAPPVGPVGPVSVGIGSDPGPVAVAAAAAWASCGSRSAQSAICSE